ncbi:MAG TPA: DUF1801 domain-containing protein [Lacibacter sp.]|nr:DUF1801 domain-containing protein [Lacibacter sp.]
MKSAAFANVEEYIAAQPASLQSRLRQLRSCIQKAAPGALECISYQMPAYQFLGKPLVYFAGYEKHIGFYATPTGHTAFAKELSKYKQGKGSVQFPNNEKLPLPLIRKIVQYRMNENKEKYGKKQKK